MSGGPSPFIPLLLVAALSVFLCWEDLVNCYGFVSKIQDATISIAIVTILAITTLFIVQSMTELIIVPLAFLLVVFLLRTELIGPLVILILIHFLGKFFCCSSEKTPSFWEGEQESKDGGGGGLGWFLFVILCLLLYAWFYEGEGYGWICLVFGMAFILYFNML
ncbi:unnamed protein product [Musa hybrid cultivar]